MEDYLQEVLRVAPSTWTGNSYNSCNYVLIEVDSSSDEYEQIVNELRSQNDNYSESIAKIERVQHPFAYGRYILRKEQFIKRNGAANVERRYFVTVPKSNIKTALEYNLDKRRTKYNLMTIAGRQLHCCIVVVKSLRLFLAIDRDCDMYPEYVVYYDD